MLSRAWEIQQTEYIAQNIAELKVSLHIYTRIKIIFGESEFTTTNLQQI